MPKQFTPKVVKKLVRNFVPLVEHQPVYVKVTGPMFEGKANPEKPDEKPADIVECINLQTGEESNMIIPAVLKSIWEESYPSDSYVGKGFAVEKLEKPWRYSKANQLSAVESRLCRD